MPITFHPNPGTILICSFEGMHTPEMIKSRPVVVVSPRLRRSTGVCSIVPLSTTPPQEVMPWHVSLMLPAPLSDKWPEVNLWAKCDLIYSFRYARLDRPHNKVGIHRRYYDRRLDDAQMRAIKQGIGRHLNIL